MVTNRIEYGYRAEPHATIHDRWIGVYHGQMIGVGQVKNDAGRVILFRSSDAAEAAAALAFFTALNGPKPAQRKPKSMTVKKTGRFGLVFRSV